MLEERRFEHSSDYLWKDRSAKTLSILKGGMKLENAGSFEEEIRWIQSRPSMREIQDLLEKAPREESLNSEERGLLKSLRETKLKASEIFSQISDQPECANLRKLQGLWTKVLDIGVRIDSFFVEGLRECFSPILTVEVLLSCSD